jgi:hypothetical protein
MGIFKCKVVPVLIYLLHHEDEWESGGITPRILNLGTGLVGSRGGPETVEERKVSCFYRVT